jgi:hypothetical protein
MVSPAKAGWQESMCAAAQAQAGVIWEAFEPDASLMERALALAQGKYSQDSYNQKR